MTKKKAAPVKEQPNKLTQQIQFFITTNSN